MSVLLFPLPLLNTGTPWVESLSSYVCRLAFAHAINPRQLLALVCGTTASEPIDGHSRLAVSVTSVLIQCTAQTDLVGGTLLRFRNVLSSAAFNALTCKRRWCPLCIGSANASEVPNNDPLIWRVKAIALCPRHDCELLHHCPSCARQQSLLVCREGCFAHCQSCGEWLGHGVKRHEPSAMELGIRKQIMSVMSRGGLPPFLPAAPRKFLLAFLPHVGNSIAELAKLFGLAASIGHYIRNLNWRPSLATLLRISAIAQQPLEHILESPLIAAAQCQFAFPQPVFPSYRHPRISSPIRIRCESALRQQAEKAGSEKSLSVAAVSRTLGVTTGYLNYAFPQLTSTLTSRRKDYRIAVAQQKTLAAKLLIERELLAMESSGIESLSQKRMIARLMKESGLPKQLLARALKGSIEKLGRSENENGLCCAGRKRGRAPAAKNRLLR